MRPRLAIVLVAVALLVVGRSYLAAPDAQAGSVQFQQVCGNAGSPGAVHHVIWIWMENESYSGVINNPNAPYQSSLANKCGLLTNFHNESHYSLDNYVAATNGQNILGSSFVNDCSPNPIANSCVSAGPSIFSQSDAAGSTWRGYNEDMPTNCDLTNVGNYVVRHNPATYFSTLGTCGQFDIPMGNLATQSGAFYSDLQNGSLPNFSFIAPNVIDDAHSSSTQAGDNWLSQIIPLITAGPNYQNGDTDIFITNDEGVGPDFALNENCSDPVLDVNQPSCTIPTIVVAPYARGGVDNTFYTHYSMLRSTEELLGLPLLGLAGSANSMTTNLNLGQVRAPPSAPPSAPTNLIAATPSSNQVALTWNAAAPGSSPVATYQISRGGNVIATTIGTGFTDSTVSAGTRYTYRVSAIDSHGLIGPASNPSSITTLGSTNLLANPGFETWSGGVPAAWTTWGSATTLTQTTDAHSGASSARVATASASYTASGVTDYTKPTIASTTLGVTYTATCWAKVSTPITVNIELHEIKQSGTEVTPGAITSLGITDGNWHQIQVSDTTTGIGNKMPLAVFTTNTRSGSGTFQIDDCWLSPGAPVDSTAPSVPTNVVATAAGSNQVNVSWSAAADNIGVTSYSILRNGVPIDTTSGTSYVDGGLAPNTPYAYTVTASDAAGNVSAQSAVATAVTTSAQVPPSAPTGLAAVSNGSSEVDLSWTAAVPGSSPVVGYQISRNGSVIGSTTTPATSFSDTTVASNSTYSYVVAAVDSGGQLSPVSGAALVTTPLVLPAAPTGLVATAAGPSVVNLSWTAAVAGSYPVAGYNVLRNGVVVGTTTGATSFVDSGLSASTTYDYTVTATDAVGETGAGSTDVSVTTLLAPVPPSAPTGLVATAAGPTAVNLSWTAAVAGSYPVAGYNVLRDGVVVGTTTGATSFVDSGLSASTTYDYTVTATDAVGETGAGSTDVSVTTLLAPVPPSAPTGLVATAAGPTVVNLSWTAAVSGSSPVVGYQISRNGSVIGTTAAVGFTDATVMANTGYNYSVTAIDANNLVSQASNVAAVVTPAVTNLLANPGFETWAGGALASWSTWGTATVLTQSNNARSGSSSVVVATTSASYTASGVTDYAKPTVSSTAAGVTFTASCWAKVSKSITVNIELHEIKQNGSEVSPAVITSMPISDGNWHQLQVSATTVGTGDKLPLAIFTTNTKAGTGTFQVDDCTLARS